MAVSPQTVVKNGKVYHYYPKGRSGSGKAELVYVRPASGGNAIKTSAGSTSRPPASSAPQPAAKAAPGAAPGAAPAPAPAPIQPFLTANDLLGQLSFDFNNAQSLADIDKGLADLGTNVGFQRQQVEKQAKQTQADATDSMIARGLFRSSVKDAALYDIEASRALQQRFFDDQLTNATLDADRRKRAITDAQLAQQNAMALQAVQNAQELSARQPAPAAPTPAAPAAAAQKGYRVVQGTSSKGQAGKWHIYPNGRKVFVHAR